MATNENYRDKDNQWQTRTEWHDVTVWGPQAERISQQLHKGSLVYLEGKITHRKWQDREGRDRYSTDIVANVIRNLDKRESGSSVTSQESVDVEMSGDATDDLPF